MKTKKLAIGLACVAMLASAAPSNAQGGMEYSITPYLWASALSGDVALGDAGGEIDVPFSDLLDAAEMVVPIHFEAKGGKWALLADVYFASLAPDLETPGPGSGDADVDMLIFELSAAWEVSDEFAIVFGSRWWDIDMGLKFVPPAPAPSTKFEAGQSWVDPLAGFRWTPRVGRKWLFTFRGDVGGFGLASDFTWNVRTGFGWEVSQVTTIMLGYHAMGIEYEENDFLFDLTFSGPEIGARFKF